MSDKKSTVDAYLEHAWGVTPESIKADADRHAEIMRQLKSMPWWLQAVTWMLYALIIAAIFGVPLLLFAYLGGTK
jgi:cell division protein FtsX